MKELIYKQDAIEAIENSSVFVFYDDDEPVDDVAEKAIISTKRSAIVDIKNVPSAEPQKKGKWILHSYMPHNNYCSNCEKDSPYNRRWNFCPNCGTDMREGEQDE